MPLATLSLHHSSVVRHQLLNLRMKMKKFGKAFGNQD